MRLSIHPVCQTQQEQTRFSQVHGEFAPRVFPRRGDYLGPRQYSQLNRPAPCTLPFWSAWVQCMTLLRSKVGFHLTGRNTLQTNDHSSDGKFGAMMSVALTNEGPVTFVVDSRSEEMDSSLSDSPSRQPGSQSGTSTPGKSTTQLAPTTTASQRAVEKALRKAAWEAAKKQTIQAKLDAPDTDSSRGPDNTAQ
jgi:D-Tyr-tRNA(Tyr) deacylase